MAATATATVAAAQRQTDGRETNAAVSRRASVVRFSEERGEGDVRRRGRRGGGGAGRGAGEELASRAAKGQGGSREYGDAMRPSSLRHCRRRCFSAGTCASLAGD